MVVLVSFYTVSSGRKDYLCTMIRYFVTLLPVLVCLFWSCQLWIDWRHQHSKAKLRLMHFSIVATLLYIGHFAYFNREYTIFPYTDTIYCMANLAVYPLYYLYLMEMTEKDWKKHWQVTLLLPSLIMGIVVGGSYAFASDAERPEIISTARFVAKIVFAIQVVVVMTKGYRRVKNFDEKVENYYADTENRTLRNTQSIMMLLVITSVMSFTANAIGKEAFADSVVLVSIPSVLFAIILFMLLRAGHKQNFAIDELMEETTETVTGSEAERDAETAPAEVTADRIRQISAEIEEVMRSKKIFLQRDLRVSDLAILLNTNRDYVSKAIRLDKGMSFAEYVNKHRIEYAIQLMKNNPQIPVLELSVKAGYTSQASFFRNFKQFTGTTPKQFMQKP